MMLSTQDYGTMDNYTFVIDYKYTLTLHGIRDTVNLPYWFYWLIASPD